MMDVGASYVSGRVLVYYYTIAEYIGSFGKKFQSKKILRQQLVHAEQERATLQAQLIELRAQQRYSDDIKELAHWREQYAHLRDARIAHVLLKHFGADGHYFLVSGGKADGLTSNMIAIIDNHLVGRVSELFPAYSKVQLITDKNLKVAACCAQTKAHGIYSGAGIINQTALNFVDHLQEVILGDMVLSSGTGLLYPQGLCLGAITNIIKNDIDYTIALKPLIDLEKLEYCFLISATTLQEIAAHSQVLPHSVEAPVVLPSIERSKHEEGSSEIAASEPVAFESAQSLESSEQ